MRLSVPLLLLLLLLSNTSMAQDVRYVSGTQNVPLRGGAGDDYDVVHRGIPAGTQLTVARTSEDGQWADIATDSGDVGWIPTQKLSLDPTEQTQLLLEAEAAAQAEAELEAESALDDGAETDSELADNPAELLNIISSCDDEFNAVAQELHRLKQVSGKAEQMDIDNSRLVEQTENLRAQVEMLQAEKFRLIDKLKSEDFMNGALAVLLGVIIALVAPRLIPKRRKTSSW